MARNATEKPIGKNLGRLRRAALHDFKEQGVGDILLGLRVLDLGCQRALLGYSGH